MRKKFLLFMPKKGKGKEEEKEKGKEKGKEEKEGCDCWQEKISEMF